MNRTIYLNYNLDDPKELTCYNALVELGQSKRSVINMLLIRAGLVDLNNTKTILQPKKRAKKKKVEGQTEQLVPEVNQSEEPVVQASESVPISKPVQQPVYQQPVAQSPIQQQVQQQSVTVQSELIKQNDIYDISDEEAAMMSQLGDIFQSMQS